MRRIGALEGGGTKMVLGVFTEDGVELERRELPTEAPDTTVPAMRDFFTSRQVDALGVASFGPVELDPSSPDYGCITTTPKLAWRGFPLLKELLGGRDLPYGLDTDVNAAALAEARLGAARGLSDVVYVTVGTGVGGGILCGGKLVHGLMHPELGHMLLRPHPDDPLPRGVCPYHDGCLEGLAAGPALLQRCGGDIASVPDDDPLFVWEAYYLAQMCANIVTLLCPQRILLGGGVMRRKALYPAVRRETLRLLNGYIAKPSITEHMEEYIAAPALYPVSGLWGAYLLGAEALREHA